MKGIKSFLISLCLADCADNAQYLLSTYKKIVRTLTKGFCRDYMERELVRIKKLKIQKDKNIGILKFFKCNVRVLIALIFLNLILSITNIANTYLLGILVDILSIYRTNKAINVFILIFVILQIMKLVSTLLSQYFTTKESVRISNSIAETIISHIHKISEKLLTNFDSVYLSERINTDANVISSFIVNTLLGTFIRILMLIFILNVFQIYGIKYVFLIIEIFVIYVFIYLAMRKHIFQQFILCKEAASNYLKSLSEQIEFLGYIQENVIYNSFINRFRNVFVDLYQNSIKLVKITNIYSGLQFVIYLIAYIYIILSAGNEVINKRMTIGEFTILFTTIGYIINSVNSLLSFGQNYQNAKASYFRLEEIYRFKPQNYGNKVIDKINVIQLNSVSVLFNYEVEISYPKIEFELGNKYLIVGHNGSGKSTLIKLISNLYDPSSGIIKINGYNIKEINMEDARENLFSIMRQELKFPDCSVIDYINLSNKTRLSVKEMAKQLVKKGFPELSYEIYDLASNNNNSVNLLSGGEKQKVELAKTVLKDAIVYIFDEPTAHLDSVTRNELYSFYRAMSQNEIYIVISHNMEEKQHFDNIILI